MIQTLFLFEYIEIKNYYEDLISVQNSKYLHLLNSVHLQVILPQTDNAL